MQNYVLLQLLKSTNKPVTREEIAEALGIAVKSVPVYIHALKNKQKVEIISVKDGRTVIGYKLADQKAEIPQFRKNNAQAPKKEKILVAISDDGELPVLDKDAEITQISDREFADIADSIGLGNDRNYGE